MTLSPDERAIAAAARRATLATITTDGRPRLVPICYVMVDDAVWSPLDEKPKATPNPRSLARVRDITERPEVSLLIDRWSEDWSELAWLRLSGRAELIEPGDVPADIVPLLRAKYPQYAGHALESRPLIKVTIERATSWFATEP